MQQTYLWLLLIFGLFFAAFIIVLFVQKKSLKLGGDGSKVPWFTRPTPTIEMDHLRFMLGTWVVYENWERGPWGSSFKGKSVFKTAMGPGGLSIMTDVETAGPLGRTFTHIVSSWNPFLEAYQGSSVSNNDYGVLFWTGRWEQNSLVFDGEMQTRGKKMALRRVLSEIKKGSYTTQEFITEPGEQRKLLVTGKAKRRD
jgi:hypothetical protein